MSRPRSPLFVLFLTVFIDLVGFGIVIPILPLYAEHFHASPVAIGWLTGIYSGMQIIFTPILGKLSDRFGRRPVLFVSIVGTAAGFALMGFAHSLTLLFAGRILAGITGGNISIPQAYIADVTAPEKRSRAMGMIGAAFGLGFTFGPLIGGMMLAQRWPLSTIFLAAAIPAVCGSAVARSRIATFTSVPSREPRMLLTRPSPRVKDACKATRASSTATHRTVPSSEVFSTSSTIRLPV